MANESTYVYAKHVPTYIVSGYDNATGFWLNKEVKGLAPFGTTSIIKEEDLTDELVDFLLNREEGGVKIYKDYLVKKSKNDK